MKFPFIVKHNGVEYPAGKEVPIGKEPKAENVIEDKTASELSKELEERFGIKMAAQKGKKALLEALEEAEAKELEEDPDAGEDEGDLEDPEGEGEPEGNSNEGSEDNEDNEDDEDQDLLNKIVNE